MARGQKPSFVARIFFRRINSSTSADGRSGVRCVAPQPKPKNYVVNAVESGEVSLHTPLRCCGVLQRDAAGDP
jgi:hypothetical protein